MSTYNHVERRIASLSKELSELILLYDIYGSHLDASGKTNEEELEKMNFHKAGENLAPVWSNLVIDGAYCPSRIYSPRRGSS